MKIAVASSGLGHVARGIETWAQDTAVALQGSGIDVTLFAAGPLASAKCSVFSVQRSGEGRPVVLPCLKRSSWQARLIARLMPAFAWRWGMTDPYGIEQLTFWLQLRRHLKRGGFDLLHVQDPMLAFWCRRARKAGRLKTKEILGHGTEERIEFLEQFEYVQHLTPWHRDEALKALRETTHYRRSTAAEQSTLRGTAQRTTDRTTDEHGLTQIREHWVAIPNFVDMKVFDSVKRAERRAKTREKLGIPQDAFVAIAVGALKKKHKRIDHLVNEMAMIVQGSKSFKVVESGPVAEDVYLILAGAREDETDEIVRLAESKLGDRCRVLADHPREGMPDLYAAADVFVHASLFEMMPIAFLEAMASGLPVICHRHPNLEWMIGKGADDAGCLMLDTEEKDEGGCSNKKLIQYPISNTQSPTPKSDCHSALRVPSSELGSSAFRVEQAAGASIDMAAEGALAGFLGDITREWIEEHGRNAREYAERMFSKDAVIGRYIEYYRGVLGEGPQDHGTTGPRDNRTTGPRDHRTTGLRDNRTTGMRIADNNPREPNNSLQKDHSSRAEPCTRAKHGAG